MEGLFGDWFIEKGRKYYENGHLRYEGDYNRGPRHYYGPRYFVKGNLYHETGKISKNLEQSLVKERPLGYESGYMVSLEPRWLLTNLHLLFYY
jgi:hypothetical protein